MIKRGFTLVELMVGMTVLGVLIIGTMTVFSETMKGFYTTNADITLASQNTLGMQRVAETLRNAHSIEITEGGNKVVYYMPLRNNTNDPITGEKEYFEPVTSDGVPRSFSVANGKLKDDYSGRTLTGKVVLKDPDPQSSQYGQAYAPFQLTTIGSRKALSINFITQQGVLRGERYQRMKTTVIIRNSS